MRKIILIGNASLTNEAIEQMLSLENVLIQGGRSHSKTKTGFITKVNSITESIPTELAKKIVDDEGYVHVMDFGKVHIQNWIDREQKQQSVAVRCHKNDFFDAHLYAALSKALPSDDNEQSKSSDKSESKPLYLPTPFQAFKDRFFVTNYTDPAGKLVRDNKIHDRQSQKTYTEQQYDTLFARITEICKESGVDIAYINAETLNYTIETIEEADRIHSEEIQSEKIKKTKKKHQRIVLSNGEIQSRFSRVAYAERLISQLPSDHDGRNTWLLNYGVGEEAIELRNKRNLGFDSKTQSAQLTSE